MTEARIETPGGSFAILAEGAADAPVTLMLHGFPDVPRSWAPLMAALAGAGFRAVAPWMRGYAPSTLDGPYTIERIGRDAVEMAEALSPGRPVAIVGHDWGAIATYEATTRAPERFTRAVTMAVPHLAAFSQNLLRHPAQLARSSYIAFFQIPRVSDAVAVRLVEPLWRRWSPRLDAPRAHVDEIRDTIARSLPAPLGYYRALARPLPDALRRARRPGRVRVPLLHLQGADDGCIGPELARGEERFFAAEFRFEVVPGVGHFLHVEEPETIARRVIAWLRR